LLLTMIATTAAIAPPASSTISRIFRGSIACLFAMFVKIPPRVGPKRFNRDMKRVFMLLTLVAGLAALAGCGSSNKSSTSSSGPEVGTDTASLGPPTILTIDYNNGKGAKQTARLTCTQGSGNSGTGYLAKQSAADTACETVAHNSQLVINGP